MILCVVAVLRESEALHNTRRILQVAAKMTVEVFWIISKLSVSSAKAT